MRKNKIYNKFTKIYNEFIKGYYRPISMPRWKWFIIYAIWITAGLSFILALLYSLWFSMLGFILIYLPMYLTAKWDTENWRYTKKGQEYLDKFEDDT